MDEKFGLKTVVPLDISLGIDKLPFKISVAMMLDIARRAINAHSYEEQQQAYEQDRGILISDDQIRFVVNELGAIIYDYDNEQKDAAIKQLAAGAVQSGPRHGTLYIEMDGAMFNTRRQNDGSTWRENKLGAIFSSMDIKYRKSKKGKEEHEILEREFISYVGDADTFKAHLYAAALRKGLNSAKTAVIISDGAKWIKSFKDTYCQGMDVVHILDFSHLKENIYKFASYFVRGKVQKQVWPEQMTQLIYEGKIDEALEKAAPYKDCKRAGIPNIYGYISNNRDCMNYPSYIDAGYFIGSGVIESGNKTVMQERLKLPGMRWEVDSAQKVLALKCKYDSGQWDSLVVPLVYRHYGL